MSFTFGKTELGFSRVYLLKLILPGGEPVSPSYRHTTSPENSFHANQIISQPVTRPSVIQVQDWKLFFFELQSFKLCISYFESCLGNETLETKQDICKLQFLELQESLA